jgi:hypothetical protein
MNTLVIMQLEETISHLSLKEQLLLLERLIQRLRQHLFATEDNRNKQLAAMANDPQIQQELKLINEEFAIVVNL